MQAMVYGVASFSTMDELMVYNALALHRRQLLRLQPAEEWEDLFQVCSQLHHDSACFRPWESHCQARRLVAPHSMLVSPAYCLALSF